MSAGRRLDASLRPRDDRGVISIRDARRDDADAVRALLGELGHRPESLGHVEDALTEIASDTRAVVLVAELEGEVVGLVSGAASRVLEYPAPQLRISAIAVSAAHRRRGIGEALVRAMEGRAAALGCFRVELTSARSLVGAHAFWRAVGYDEVGLRFVRRLARS